MIYAKNKAGETVFASPNACGICPQCEKELTPKCGSVKVWHWAHKSNKDCDSWTEGETEWHHRWKTSFAADWCEKTITNMFGRHRADVLIPDRGVIEFQNSPIGVTELREREEFYGKMVWVLNGTYETGFGKNIFSAIKGDSFNQFDRTNFYRWKFPHKRWQRSDRPVFIDRGYDLLLIESWEERETTDEWGSRTSTYLWAERLSPAKFHQMVTGRLFWEWSK